MSVLLYDAAVEKGATYVFGVSIESFTETDHKVEVKLTDGGTERFDLVGYDGQGSRVRKLMLAGGSVGGDIQESVLTALPERIAYFTVLQPKKEGQKCIATAYIMPWKRFILTRRHNPEQIQVYLKVDAGSGSGQLQSVKRGDVFYCQYSGVVKMNSCSRRRVKLVGDAGYCCPSNGFGASIALMGAYLLAREIGERCYGRGETAKSEDAGDDNGDGPLAALKAYEDKFQALMKKIQKPYSAEPSVVDKIAWTPSRIGLFNFTMGIISSLRLDKIAFRFMPSESSHGLELPAYEKMVKG